MVCFFILTEPKLTLQSVAVVAESQSHTHSLLHTKRLDTAVLWHPRSSAVPLDLALSLVLKHLLFPSGCQLTLGEIINFQIHLFTELVGTGTSLVYIPCP